MSAASQQAKNARNSYGRIGYGMEIEPKYVAVALQRLADMGLAPALVESA